MLNLVLNLRLVTKQQARDSKRIFAHGGQVDVNTTDETADGAFLFSSALASVNRFLSANCKRMGKATYNCLEYQISLIEEKHKVRNGKKMHGN